MSNIDQIIDRYAEVAGTRDAKFLKNANANVFVGSRWNGNTANDTIIYSYGTHFPMAIIMPDGKNNRGWWLVNGDNYSPTTSRHQSAVRGAVQRTGLPVLIVPFSALDRAGINKDSIKAVHIRPDRYTWEPRVSAEEPSWWPAATDGDHGYYRDYYQNLRRLEDGRYAYEVKIHHLGDSLFTAQYEYKRPEWDDKREEVKYYRRTAYFLSSFDENEPGFGLYFLAELPKWAKPATVEEAFESLKPDEVISAELDGIAVKRQGDVFAIPWGTATKDLPGPSVKQAHVLGVNHSVTEMRQRDGHTYARGTMRHRPRESWRRPEHKRLSLGRQWHEVVRNTVPDGRSWSIQGNVD